MKVAVVSTYYGSDMGGAEVSSRLLVEGLRTAGHTVEVFGLTNSLTWLPLSVKAFLLNTHYLDRYVENWLFKSLNGKDFDVVHIQDLMISVGAVRACNRLSLKSVVTVRDVRFVCNLSVCQEDSQLCHGCTDSKYLECLKIESKRRYDVSALAHLLKPFIQNRSVDLCGALLTASTVVAISKFISGELLELGIESTVVYNPMPEWKLEKRIKNEDLVLFAPGRLESYKGHQYLISAIPKVLASGKRVQLRIAGTGGYEGELKKLVKTLKLESCVSFLGKLNYDEMHEEYRKSDLVVFPSIWLEPLGRIGLEAMAIGRPILANNVGGIVEVVGKENTCNVRDTDEFAKAILIRRAKLKVNHEFGMENFVKKVVEVYSF